MRCLPVLVTAAALTVTTLSHTAGAGVIAIGPPVPVKDGGPRVRPSDDYTATLLRDGLRRSPTLAALVDRIEAGDVIVYLELPPGLHRGLAGCLKWAAHTGRFRYVRALLSSGLTPDAQIAALGHELEHVAEIIAHPEVTDQAGMLRLYERIGHRGGLGIGTWDTIAARDTGVRVRAEVAATAALRAADSGPFGPAEWYAWYKLQRAGSI